MAKRTYQQLQPEERMRIDFWREEGLSLRAIARKLKRAPSTLSRELARNTQTNGLYCPRVAQASCDARRQAGRPDPKLAPDSILWGLVRRLLCERQWSPQEIAGTLKRVFPDDPSLHVSHETIYNAIYAQPRGELRRELIACLRQHRNKRLPRSRGTDRRATIPDMISIHVRPPEIDDRLMPGHWEGDLIKGAENKSSVAVLVERMSRAVLLAKMPDATAASALAAFTTKLQSLVEPLRQTLTYDQGREMARHAELSAATNVRVYFCDPHSPWQRGTCENTNGLLRQYLPKGTDLSIYSQDDLDAIADKLNTRPRATLNWRTPLEILAQVLANPTDRLPVQ
ncbi:IS30 family transposase [Burkholderia sp. Bp8963]|uniref:IS30 family transposase n=1 Tax=Burkholderia sp. Bp8963 TaxID=2184547 RepID=UPI000F5B2560|nr:IS30 family transposase [Burkholderia sp. Bp8963]RQS69210.1 IS30 family transposase [Burkholderia sp. Bp8963]